MNHYTRYHVGLLQEFKGAADGYPPLSNLKTNTELSSEVKAEAKTEQAGLGENNLLEDTDQEWINTLNSLCQMQQYTEQYSEQGQWLVTRIVSAYSHLMPLLSRDLLWFFGGDCLHYMPDEELSFYQQLDELRYAAEENGEDFDIAEAKKSLSNVSPHQ